MNFRPVSEPGSFRDPSSRIVHDGERILRLLDQRGARAWHALARTSFFEDAVARHRLIATREVGDAPPGVSAVLEHPRLPLITYPYEWTFSMLRDAALLQLDLLSDALGEGLTMKDATPFNIQFVDAGPIFIDVGSFDLYQPGDPWIGYRQFTRQFLFPLLLRAWADVPFQPWLRGRLQGPTARDMRQILSLRRRLTPSAFAHITLQAQLERKVSGPTRDRLQKAGFSLGLILANVRRLRRLIERLRWSPSRTAWTDYASHPHVAQDRSTKIRFLREAIESVAPALVLDLGANDGTYCRVVAEHGCRVVALDADESVLDRVYQSAPAHGISVVLCDVTDPSPSQGWRNRERPDIFDRIRPELVIAYGLIHHLLYKASIPLREIVEWLRSFGCPIVVEFVEPDDPLVRVITADKKPWEVHPERTDAQFRALAGHGFSVARWRALPSGHRHLYLLVPH